MATDSNNVGLSRRGVLRGLGVTLALPMLESLPGARAFAASTDAALTAPPVRMAMVFIPNGVNYAAWNPAIEGDSYALSQTLEPLAPVRQHLSVIRGLTLAKARANGDGPGDHARSAASFLTGRQARKTAGNDIHNGVSADQIAAGEVGRATRLPSIELGCEQGPSAGNCDSGYSCAYSSNISWRADDAPMPKIVDPGAAFERLFGDARDAATQQARLSRRQSILDFVRDDSARLASRLGASDRRKLDQFQTSVREIELRIQRARDDAGTIKALDYPAPAGIPETFSQHIDLHYDLLLLAFQTDTTRIGTYMLGNDGSNRTFPEISVKEGHHHLSHHQNNAEMIEQIRRIDRFYVERFARFVSRLASTPEGEGTLLDNCMVMYGGGISDGNRHNHEDLPIILAGRAGGTIDSGRLIDCPKDTPLCNLYVSMLQRMGCGVTDFGDSTGALGGLGA